MLMWRLELANVDPFTIQFAPGWHENPETMFYLNRFLHDLWLRTGGGDDSVDSADIRESYPWPMGDVPPPTTPAISLYSAIPDSESQLRAVTVLNDYTACSKDFINAKNGATITFPQYPEEGAVFIVRNGDGSRIRLLGNGKKMNGENDGSLFREGTAIEFYYFIDSDEWVSR